jgi:hypothetical protein
MKNSQFEEIVMLLSNMSRQLDALRNMREQERKLRKVKEVTVGPPEQYEAMRTMVDRMRRTNDAGRAHQDVEKLTSPKRAHIDVERKTLVFDGEPFPWPVIGLSTVHGKDRVTTVTVAIPVESVTVLALEPDGGDRQGRSAR